MLSDVKLKSGASDFRVFRENVKQAVMLVLENNRFSKGIFSWVGFETHYLNYEIDKRLSGKTKFSFGKKISYALEGIVSFSVRPLKIVGLMGISLSLLSFIYLFYIIIKTIIYGAKTPGFATLASLILIATGTILTVLGLIGEYLIRTFIETKKRPIYIEKSKLGFDDTIL